MGRAAPATSERQVNMPIPDFNAPSVCASVGIFIGAAVVGLDFMR